MARLLFNLRGPLILLPHPLTRLIVSNTRQWHQWIQVVFSLSRVDKKGNHLHAGDMFKWGKVRWIKMQLNSFVMLWPNYALILLPSFTSTPASHIPFKHIMQDWFWWKHLCWFTRFFESFADFNWIYWKIECVLNLLHENFFTLRIQNDLFLYWSAEFVSASSSGCS